MIVCTSRDELSETLERWKDKGFKTGFVPTMGALHDGHLSLVALAAESCDRVMASVYVNPTQFAPHEDFDEYPRDTEGDLSLLEQAGVRMVYLPRSEDIYPDGERVTVRAGEANAGLDSDFRPHFFHGVATVVHTLFTHLKPDVAVFGEKDFQQLMVIREMVEREGLDIEIVGAPIIRDEQGLALSSRNQYLSEDQLGIARMLNQIMYKAAEDIRGGAAAQNSCKEAIDALLTCGFDKVDYVTYKPEWNRVLVAGWVGKTRLIDNCAV
jgi:pantoate--beta-alanine ligase